MSLKGRNIQKLAGGAHPLLKVENSSFCGGWAPPAGATPRKRRIIPPFAGDERLPPPGAPTPRKRRIPPPWRGGLRAWGEEFNFPTAIN